MCEVEFPMLFLELRAPGLQNKIVDCQEQSLIDVLMTGWKHIECLVQVWGLVGAATDTTGTNMWAENIYIIEPHALTFQPMI